MGYRKSSSNKEVHYNTGLHQEENRQKKKKSQYNLTPNRTRKKMKLKVSRRKEIIRMSVEINEIEAKKIVERLV